MVKFKDFSRPLSVFQVLFKASLIFKDFSRQSFIFKDFSVCANGDTPHKGYVLYKFLSILIDFLSAGSLST